MYLLSTRQRKMEKSKGRGYQPMILHLFPHKLDGKVICAKATKGCSSLCYGRAGVFGMPLQTEALKRKTRMFFQDRKLFLTLLRADIMASLAKAESAGDRLSVRLNGTSDLAWEKIVPSLFTEFPTVQFYDYTKLPGRFDTELPENYHLTFSLSENNEDKAMDLLEKGHNVAVVFRRKPGHPFPVKESLPRKWRGYKVIDGDKHDLRFTDPMGVVVGLRAKGRAYHDKTGFVQE